MKNQNKKEEILQKRWEQTLKTVKELDKRFKPMYIEKMGIEATNKSTTEKNLFENA